MPVETARIEETIRRLLAAAGEDRTLSPTDVARALAPDPEWPALLPKLRRTAVAMALAGRLVIYRKGKPVDPTDFKGVWRMGLPRQD